MVIIDNVPMLTRTLDALRGKGADIGFVPTMGALHAGHASLVERSVEENAATVVSVFVNPTQFNDQSDLATYPRTLEADARLLESLGADVMFAPGVAEMYPEPDTRHFDYPPITSVMEGPRRPGHFNGVCQVVSKLFRMVRPTRAYFGEKDFQQIAVVLAMTADLGLPVEICSCPIVREPDGLAMSSRNARLTPEERSLAANISRTLFYSRDYARSHSVSETQATVLRAIDTLEGLQAEYFEIVDDSTLQPVAGWDDAPGIVGCLTAYCGSRHVRLIDNIRYKG
ncbi:MAG: pantoate--beta-alanine ligase [Alloprevotella sp.]|nr:pantoate--beta-alanine ligase [Alloprevotella sp.]